MSRRRSGELDFGSDSFLDIIANIVGILIILIVVAGLRAARAPARVIEKTETPSKAEPPPQFAAAEIPSPPRPVVLPPIPQPVREAESSVLVGIQSMRRKLANAKARNNGLLTRLRNAKTAQQTAELSHAQTMRATQFAALSTDETADRIRRLKSSQKRNRESLVHLRRKYDEAQRTADKTETIQHRLTPLGRNVTGQEVHFRVAGGKVAHVPIKDLVKRMRDEVVRRKSWLIKFPTHKGTVGPVKGFTMDYVVQRQLTSAMNDLRNGVGQVRIMLAGWKIEPTGELEAESLAEALATDSRFLQEVRVAPDTATLTFWVYPDSFAVFRRLQKAARAEGLRVAARPLPFGVPIAGSPRGSRSSGQ